MACQTQTGVFFETPCTNLYFLGFNVLTKNAFCLAHEECLSSCSENSLWKYKIGKRYVYNYNVEVATIMKGTSDEDSRMTMAMKANFVHTSQCNFDLKVNFLTNIKSFY